MKRAVGIAVVALMVGILVGVAWAQSRFADWQATKGGLARLELPQDGVVCYAALAMGQISPGSLTCLKIK